ncbi:MAG TPA: PEP/pyruvate-binding domain-containing protein [Verrucomicrobiae bacterium]|nr:PEP/pyruvate-binding domain-containing protein [Verrucomicrobiae bacterium]
MISGRPASGAQIWIVLVSLLAFASLTFAQPSPRLEIHQPVSTNDWMRLRSSFHSNSVLTLEASTNFTDWKTIGTLHDALFNYPDTGREERQRRFYRAIMSPRVSTNDWKNELRFPEDTFRSPYDGGIRWVKFAILLDDPTRVYYQDSTKFPFHYEFAVQRLAPFLGMDRTTFDAVSLRRTNQQVVLGTVLYPARSNFVEYGVQFVGLDAYTVDEIAQWFALVKATVFATNGAGAFYMPVFEQEEMARTHATEFAARNIAVASVERWGAVNHVYAPGWALGRLKFFPAAEIAAAFADGRLLPSDILLTDGVPAETPLVAGIISLTPSTPNSHTAILAKSFGIPFVHLPDANERARVQGLVGHKVILRATITFDVGEAKVLDVEGGLDPALEATLLALKQTPPIAFQPKQTFGALSASTDTLGPADIRYFGGKAANYGLLRDSVPNNAPPAIAFSFDLWDAFLDQTLPGGQTLRATIATRLSPYTNYPPNIPALLEDLDDIRDLIAKTATFTAAQKQAITNALMVFNPNRKIRFRSSTNVEDSEHFTGAGLYDSYSGCLLDDLDSDNQGPSLCDPTESEERGVFRAIQKVFASFYNDYAFLERLRHGVDESLVGMAVLVHHSFPDEEELANGVATLRFRYPFGTQYYDGDLVSQLGAESVTNPDGTAVPEVIAVNGIGASLDLTLTRRSSRVPLGDYVMKWEADYRGMMDLLKAVGSHYRTVFPAKTEYYLDFEYKKDVNLGLVVKQVREVPAPATTNQAAAVLINELTTYSVAQKEAADVFSNHRLKSLWTLETRTIQLSASNLVAGIHAQGHLQYISNSTIQTLSGPLSTWPGASNAPTGTIDYWTTGSGTNQCSWQLETTLITSVTGAKPPIVTQQDFTRTLRVNYATPMPRVFASNPPETTTNEFVVLEPRPEILPGMLLQQRTAIRTNVVTIQTSFYWPDPGDGFAGGYTAPLVRFVETSITGLTTAPIVLTNYFSQTYRPGHHNFSEEFIFEPRLEPGLSPAAKAELEAANIQLLYLRLGSPAPIIRVLGFDQNFRDL